MRKIGAPKKRKCDKLIHSISFVATKDFKKGLDRHLKDFNGGRKKKVSLSEMMRYFLTEQSARMPRSYLVFGTYGEKCKHAK